MAPKVEALDRIATAEGSLCGTDTAKTLQVQPKTTDHPSVRWKREGDHPGLSDTEGFDPASM